MNRRPLEIAPSILAANFAILGAEVRAVEEAGASVIHVDVMDGHFVPNISIGVPIVQSLSKATRLPLDVHLMIERPGEFVAAFAKAGAHRIIVHQEATAHLDRVIASIHEQNREAGVAINPATPVKTLSEIWDRIETVLVMTVNPGFGGQKFIPQTVEKIRELQDARSRYNCGFRIAVDGGVVLENTAELVSAGADTLVAGTSIFHTPNPGAAVREMRQAANEAISQRV
ncbi:MAG TPA: ribulose-phosphate 3-epimerase [Candidatus Acidoferrales bacterium]|nr:ribulose-phosphate 3-epimerase [Candidatus Acidoferrales bacterium]